MKLSARNTLKGKITRVTRGAVNAEITLELAPDVEVVAVITLASVDSLELGTGQTAYAVIKASNVMIAVDD